MNMKPVFQKNIEVKKKSPWKCVEGEAPSKSSDRVPCLVLIDKQVQAAYLQDGKFNKEGVTHYVLAPKELPDG